MGEQNDNTYTESAVLYIRSKSFLKYKNIGIQPVFVKTRPTAASYHFELSSRYSNAGYVLK